MAGEATSEADLSTERAKAGETPRLPAPDVHPSRSGHHQSSASEGPRPALGVTWRIRDRTTFVELRRRGVRARIGPLSVAHLPDDLGQPPRIAYAIGRHVGGAVVRNRVRRRLQAAVTELVTTGHHQLPSGAYLFTVAPPAVELSFDGLKDNVAAVIDLAQRRTRQPGAAR